jgi:site-specific DNA-methyltransferase (adenine-specific)
MSRRIIEFDGGHRGVFENARDMREIEDGAVSCIVTSPPYNIDMPYKGYDDYLPIDKYYEMLCDVFMECYRVSKLDAVMFVNFGLPRLDPMLPWNVARVIHNHGWWVEDEGGDGCLCAGWQLQQTIAWVKSISIDLGDDVLSMGHYRPKKGGLLSDTWEPVFLFAKDRQFVDLNRLAIGVPYADKSNVERWDIEEDKRCRGSAWFIPYETTQASREHPAPFPVDLAGKAILLGSNEGDTVLDPFMGSGTTLLAAKSHGRIGIGYDVDPSNEALVVDSMSKIYDPNQFGTLCSWRYDEEQVF